MTVTRISAVHLAAIASMPLASFLPTLDNVQYNAVVAATIFRDTFDDGDPTNGVPVSELDGTPITWSLNLSRGADKLEIDSGRLVLSCDGPWAIAGTTVWPNVTLNLSDMSIRSRVRLLAGDTIFLNPVRDPNHQHPGYVGVIGDGFAELSYGGNLEEIDRKNTNLDVSKEDLIVQLDAIGDKIELWAWRPGEVPVQPLLSIDDQMVPVNGAGDVYIGVAGSPARAEFEFIQTADESIPILLGDFNYDGTLTGEDIDLLSAAVQKGENDAEFDLNHDGLVGEADRTFWVHDRDVMFTYYGDTNLDGEFNSADLVAVFQSGHYEDGIARNSGWADGDWDGDAEFTSGDLVTAFRDSGYEVGPRAMAVPELSGMSLAALAALLSVLRTVRNVRTEFDF